VAANTWLEALAKLRRAAGLPATCVRWGAIDDVGFLARNEDIKNALLGRMGGSAISSSLALGMLESFLRNDRSGSGVLELDWKALSSFLPNAGSPKFRAMLRQVGNSESDDNNFEDLQRLVAELSDEELLSTVTGLLAQEVGEILRISPEKIDVTRQMSEMGLDSLMAVELATAIQSRFGVDLPVMTLSDSPTVAKIADLIVKQLRSAGDSDENRNGEDIDILARVQEAVAKHGVDATGDEIAALADEISSTYSNRKVRMVQ
jgi:acyl carrier protein